MAKFEKGQSGNPAGRPKLAPGTAFTKELRRQLAEVDPSTGKQNIEVIVAAVVRRGKRGEHNAIQTIAERLEGKVTQPMSLEANLNVSREKRVASIEELLAVLPVPAEPNGSGDKTIN